MNAKTGRVNFFVKKLELPAGIFYGLMRFQVKTEHVLKGMA